MGERFHCPDRRSLDLNRRASPAGGCKAGWHPGPVLDPFAGRGTAGIMALKLGRRFIGFDLNPDFMELTNKNLKNSRVKIKRKKKIPIE